MKIFLVTAILATGLFALVISLDLLMGVSLQGIISKALNPFRVMEAAEYIILALFFLFFIFSSIGAYLNKKKGENTS